MCTGGRVGAENKGGRGYLAKVHVLRNILHRNKVGRVAQEEERLRDKQSGPGEPLHASSNGVLAGGLLCLMVPGSAMRGYTAAGLGDDLPG